MPIGPDIVANVAPELVMVLEKVAPIPDKVLILETPMFRVRVLPLPVDTVG
jgi:hypothetical protein